MVEYNPLNITTWINDNLKDQNITKDVSAVGQFDESTLLVSWTSGTSGPQHQSQHDITYIGISEIRTASAKVVMQFSGCVKIVFASISQDLNIIAFVTEDVNHETNEKSWQAHIHRCIPQDPGVTCVPLTDNHDTQIQVQFLSDFSDVQMATEGSMGVTPLTLSLLVLIHKHSIQIHHFEVHNGQLIRLSNRNVLCLQFLWYQWIPSQQCLAFLHPCGSLSDSCVPTGKTYEAHPLSDQETMLSCIQFTHKRLYTTVFSIPAQTFGLNEPLDRSSANDDFYLNKISLPRLNLHIILWREGNVCVCYQPFVEENLDTEISGFKESENATTPLYFVTLLHHGVQFQAVRSKESDYSASWPIHFAMIQDHQLLVLSAGGPAHILDTDPSHRTGFQIFIPEYFWPSNLQGNISVISMPNIGAGSSILLSCQPSLCGVSLALNQDELVSLFCSTQVPNNRKSILHYFATHIHDVTGMKKILTAISHDVWSLETRELLTEYLLGSTYARLKKSGISCHPILYHLPLSERTETVQMYYYIK